MRKIVIVTDLDGTLLDPESYSFSAALPALKLIRERSIPLVICSSKTRQEIEVYRKRLYNADPFISENGGGVFIPLDYFSAMVRFPAMIEADRTNGYHSLALGEPYAEIRRKFIQLRSQLKSSVQGFGDMSVARICALTHLKEEEARLAKQRDFEEPFVFEDAVDDRFLKGIEAIGLHWTQGSLFHMMGNHDKGQAVRILLGLFQKQYNSIVSIGLGDGLNDLPLLAAVDCPVLIGRRKELRVDKRAIPNLMEPVRSGPAGWSEAMLQLLDDA